MTDKTPHPDRTQSSSGRKPTRRDMISFGVIATGAIAASGYFLWPVVRQSGLFSAATAATPVAISMSGFAPSQLRAKAGEPIMLRLINKDNSNHSDGGGWHQFAIDGIDVDFKVAPLDVVDVSFTIAAPGTYDFYCGVCCGGKANPYMHGQLVVEA